MTDRKLRIHDMMAGVDKPWMGAAASVPEQYRPEIEKGLAAFVDDIYAASSGVEGKNVFARSQYIKGVWTRMEDYLATMKAEGKVEDFAMKQGMYFQFHRKGWTEKILSGEFEDLLG